MSLIRKHAALWALLSCFALAAAAPYLIPANPDSAVFRSGTLGMMLELACFYPIYRQLCMRADAVCQRAGLWFSICRRSEYRLRAVCLRWAASRHGQSDSPFCRACACRACARFARRKAAFRTRTAENRQTPRRGLGICASFSCSAGSRFARFFPGRGTTISLGNTLSVWRTATPISIPCCTAH